MMLLQKLSQCYITTVATGYFGTTFSSDNIFVDHFKQAEKQYFFSNKSSSVVAFEICVPNEFSAPVIHKAEASCG